MRFYKGKKVRVKNNLRNIEDFRGGLIPSMEEFEGKIVTITNVYDNKVHIKEDDDGYVWDLRAFEELEGLVINKDDIKEGDIITLRNGDRLLIDADKDVSDLSGKNNNPVYSLYCFENDMTYRDGNSNYDIVKVERPVEYSIVYDKEAVREMTVEEISKALGYEVKVVK